MTAMAVAQIVLIVAILSVGGLAAFLNLAGKAQMGLQFALCGILYGLGQVLHLSR